MRKHHKTNSGPGTASDGHRGTTPGTRGHRGGHGSGHGGKHHRKRGKRPFDHGDLRLMTLDLVAEHPRHGYEIIKQIEERFDGAYTPSPGAIYPTLAWLEDTGFVTLEQAEGGRKSAHITVAGRAFLDANGDSVAAIWARKKALIRAHAPKEVVAAMDELKAALHEAIGGEVTPDVPQAIAQKIRALAKDIAGSPASRASEPASVITRTRFEPKRRMLTVRTTEYLTPHMIRMVLEGDEMDGFVSLGFDDHIKLFFPGEGEKPEMRDYTPRAFDIEAKTLTLDFAVHDAGPATDWAIKALPGDSLQIGGPRGSSVIDGAFDWWLLIGDETALPAIGRKIEALPKGTQVETLVAVPGPEDEQSFDTEASVQSHWVHRPVADADRPAPLLDAARELELPPGTGFVWIAAEAAVAKALKTHFLEDRSHVGAHIKAAGYWVKGNAATSDKSL